MRLRSCRTRLVSIPGFVPLDWELTSHAGEKLTSERLNLTAREGNKSVALQKVEDALSQQICDNADVVAEVKTIAKVNALVAIGFVI